ncbi:MAG TPA: Rho termination factor N-terminal domain-containing protein [Solirubrobacteraceae bacterium]|nr:Rho termination factor N-terminal domain-containing protein [Solirubrobacteraceae bacterium]
MSIIDRASLEQSPLADLHAIASELSVDGYRRMRKEELIDAILRRQEGDDSEGGAGESEEPAPRLRRGRRGGRGRRGAGGREEVESEARGEGAEEIEAELESASAAEAEDERAEETVEGVVELLPGGAAFIRVNPPEPSDQDVYVSAAQVRRCELVSGDQVGGPRRPPRRSERFASLVRVDTINGRPASEVADSTRFEDLPVSFPTERLRLDSEDPTVKLLAESLPIGHGSRVTIVGERQAGKTETLRRLAIALAAHEQADVRLVLTGVRPEEVPEWRAGPVEPTAVVSMAASAEAQAQAVEGVLEQARRLAARGVNAVVLIDSLEELPRPAARRVLAAARNIVDGGSVTVVATAPAALGGETAVIALDARLTAAGKFPAIDTEASWTMRAELLAAG